MPCNCPRQGGGGADPGAGRGGGGVRVWGGGRGVRGGGRGVWAAAGRRTGLSWGSWGAVPLRSRGGIGVPSRKRRRIRLPWRSRVRWVWGWSVHGLCIVDRDNMGQDAWITWSRLDCLNMGRFLKKVSLEFWDWSAGDHVPNFLARVPFLECGRVTFRTCIAGSIITFCL